MNGVINIFKEKGLTSHDVVRQLRRILKIKKVGHTGTLDPDAVGVLPVCVGKAVKIADYITSDVKEYVATVTLGVVTTTCDASGDVVSRSEVFCDVDMIKNVVNSFVGEQLQVPPMYSAIKVNGVKLYSYARAGISVERVPRKVTIYEIEILEILSNKIKMRILCSKGTYIRALAFDIGEMLGCGAHLSFLVRTKSACFSIEDSVMIDKIEASNIYDFIIPIDCVLKFPKISVVNNAAKYLINGNKISNSFLIYPSDTHLNITDKILVYGNDGKQLVGIYEVLDGFIKPLKMLL